MEKAEETVYIYMSPKLITSDFGAAGLEFDLRKHVDAKRLPLVKVTYPHGASNKIFRQCVSMQTQVPLERLVLRNWHSHSNGNFRPGRPFMMLDDDDDTVVDIGTNPFEILFLEERSRDEMMVVQDAIFEDAAKVLVLIKLFHESKLTILSLDYHVRDTTTNAIKVHAWPLILKRFRASNIDAAACDANRHDLLIYREECVRKSYHLELMNGDVVLHNSDILVVQIIKSSERGTPLEDNCRRYLRTSLTALDLTRPKLAPSTGLPQAWWSQDGGQSSLARSQLVLWKMPDLQHCFNNKAYSDVCLVVNPPTAPTDHGGGGDDTDVKKGGGGGGGGGEKDAKASLSNDLQHKQLRKHKRGDDETSDSRGKKTPTKRKKQMIKGEQKGGSNASNSSNSQSLDDDEEEEEGGGKKSLTCRRFYVYLGLVAGGSQYFQTLMTTKNNFAESKSNEIIIDDCDPEAFEIMLRYLYGLPIPVTIDAFQDTKQLVNLVLVANRFQVNDLCDKAAGHLCMYITVDNCLDLLLLAVRTSASSLRRHCIFYAGEKAANICKQERFLALCQENPVLVSDILHAAAVVAADSASRKK